MGKSHMVLCIVFIVQQSGMAWPLKVVDTEQRSRAASHGTQGLWSSPQVVGTALDADIIGDGGEVWVPHSHGRRDDLA